jgi:hypothetical protein
MARLRPGSRASDIFDALVDLTGALGRGATVGELRKSTPTHFGGVDLSVDARREKRAFTESTGEPAHFLGNVPTHPF